MPAIRSVATSNADGVTRRVEEQFPIVVVVVPDTGLPVNRLKEFFLPPPGVAVIFVEHLQTDDPLDISAGSMSAALINLAPRRKIRVVADRMPLEKDRLYIVPAGLNVDIIEGRFMCASSGLRATGSYLPDYFLSRMAASFGDRVTAILPDLTGMLGARAVHGEGGFVYTLDRGPNNTGRTPISFPAGSLLPGQFIQRLREVRTPGDWPGQSASAGRHKLYLPEAGLGQLMEQQVFPLLWKSRIPDEPLRIWAVDPGCADIGYSIAIWLFEFLRLHPLTAQAQIFVTQLNARKIASARRGFFEETALRHLRDDLRERYFIHRNGGSWQIIRPIQQMCVFANHHLVADPPFAHCDLIFCSDAIPLLRAPEREKLFRSLHFALKPHGFLLTGKAAEVVEVPLFFQPAANIPGLYSRHEYVKPATEPAMDRRPLSETEKEANNILMTGYVPAAMLVDHRLRIIRFYGIVSPFLRQQTERPSLDLLNLLRDDLVFDVGELFEQAERTGKQVVRRGIFLSGEGSSEYQLEVLPILHAKSKGKLLIIREQTTVPAETAGDPTACERITTLEHQLQKLKYQLQTSHRLFRRTQEQLQAANEKMAASNTELQSINVELQVINAELQLRIKELESSLLGYQET